VRRAAALAALCALGGLLAAPVVARAQGPVSPRLERAISRDSVVLAWVLARPGADLALLAQRLERLGATVRVRSRFVNGVSVRLRGRALREAARWPEVRRVQAVAQFVRRRTDGRTDRRTEDALPLSFRSVRPAVRRSVALDSVYGPLAWPIDQLNIRALHDRGLRGAGVRIALLDAGFDTQHPLMAGATVIAQHDFVYGDSVVRDQPGEAAGEMTHGTAVWSTIAADVPGTLVGVAPDAEFLLAKTEFTLTETRVEEDHWVAAVEWADSLGAHIISSSLGYRTFDGGFTYAPAELDGDVAVTTVAADRAAARGILVVVSAGNDGPSARTLGTPADGDSVVAVGATDSLGAVASFSARGPTADGRIKPDVVAPGVRIASAAPDSGVFLLSGTSFAAPLVSGLAALVQGARSGQPALELRRGLIAAGDSSLAPGNTRGYGIPDARRLLAWPSGLFALGGPDTLLPSVTPLFAWDAGSGAAGVGPSLYRLRIARDSAFTVMLLDTTVLGTSVELRAVQAPGTRFFWRVVGTNDDLAVTESTMVRGPDVVPPWVRLLTLASPAGHSIRDSQPVFVWRPAQIAAAAGPFSFDVDVYPAARGPAAAVATARGLADTTFTPPAPLERNLPYRWRVIARTPAGDSTAITSPGTFIVLDERTPTASVLFQNFPNPFPNAALGLAATCFWFDVAETGPVELAIYDLRGRLVKRLTPNFGSGLPANLPAGRWGRPSNDASGTCDPRFTWDGRDETGAYVRPGVYLYRLTAPRFRQTRHVVFLGAP
jgi:hypothetical protein